MINIAEAAAELAKRRKARRDVLAFTTYTKPDYYVNWHHQVVADVLTDVVRGLLSPDHELYLPPAPSPAEYVPGQNAPKRVIINLPPRNGKSELVSRRLPAFAFGLNPDLEIISLNYSADLAHLMNRDVQRIIMSREYRNLFPGVGLNEKNVRSDNSGSYLRNADIFEIVGRRGRYRSAGVGGGIAGMGAGLLICDDLIKNKAEAESEAFRNKIWAAYVNDAYSRLEQNAAVIMMFTRWHEDDPVGRLLDLELKDSRADQWLLIELPALFDEIPSEADAPQRHASYTRFEQRTQMGAPLWPAKFDAARLEAIRANNPFDFEAIQQQRPVKPGGDLFPEAQFRRIPEFVANLDMQFVRYWDKGGTEGGGAYTAGVLMCYDPHRTHGVHFIVLDVKREQYAASTREQLIHNTAVEDAARPYHVTTWLEQEPGSGGKESAENTKINTLAGYDVESETASGEKSTRWKPFSNQVKAGNVGLLVGPWVTDYVNELKKLPSGKYKDQADASAGGFNKLVLGWEQTYTVVIDNPEFISPY